MFKFLRTKHRSQYISLGWKYKMWPDKVRKLAHGKNAHSPKEKKVVHALLDLGIIHRHQYYDSYGPDDNKVVFGS